MLKLTPRQREYIKSHVKEHLSGDNCRYWHGNLMNSLWEKNIINREYLFSDQFINMLKENNVKLYESEEIACLLLDPVFENFCYSKKRWRKISEERDNSGYAYNQKAVFQEKYRTLYNSYSDAKNEASCVRKRIYDLSREEIATGKIYIPPRLY